MVWLQPHSSYSCRATFFVLIRIREFLDRITSSYCSITLEVGTQAVGEKMPGEPLELALQENPLWTNPQGISSASRIAPLPVTPRSRVRILDVLVIEKGAPIASYRVALTRSSVRIPTRQSTAETPAERPSIGCGNVIASIEQLAIDGLPRP